MLESALFFTLIFAAQDPPVIEATVDKPGHRVAPTFYGSFFPRPFPTAGGGAG